MAGVRKSLVDLIVAVRRSGATLAGVANDASPPVPRGADSSRRSARMSSRNKLHKPVPRNVYHRGLECRAKRSTLTAPFCEGQRRPWGGTFLRVVRYALENENGRSEAAILVEVNDVEATVETKR